MKVKHLLLMPVLIYLIYLDIYTITHFELFSKKPTSFEVLAGVSFIFSCAVFSVLIFHVLKTKTKEIENFLNKKIL